MGDMARNVPLQAWQMGAPGRAAQYQAELYPETLGVQTLSGVQPPTTVNQGGFSGAGALGGALGGGMMGSMLGLSNPYTAAMMLGGGLLSGI